MKTILYQPLFINPQAYFVFPQLYHIEKGDSYIEPANITGQLIIQNLSCNAKIPEQENSILLVDGTPNLNVGVTSQRPGNADNGFQFFDMTLRKPIWWNGSSWVDANGATV